MQHLRVDGTAFLIAPGWAMTATHVVLEYLASIDGTRPDDLPRDGRIRDIQPTFDLAVGILGEPPTVTTVHVVKSHFAFPGDICLLRLKEGQFDWSRLTDYPRLRLLPPAPDDAVTAVGFPSSAAADRESAPTLLTLAHSFSTGRVVEVHQFKRDSFNLDFACYQTTANFVGGMSGGPVMDEHGAVCGVVSTSYKLADGEEPISFAATLWQAAIINLADAGTTDQRPFLDVLRGGSFSVLDADRLRLSKNSAGQLEITLVGI